MELVSLAGCVIGFFDQLLAYRRIASSTSAVKRRMRCRKGVKVECRLTVRPLKSPSDTDDRHQR
jgi:hypothetical protein